MRLACLRRAVIAGLLAWAPGLALILASLLAGAAPPARPAENTPGRFDYYVLSLSWSPHYCTRPEARDEETQCESGRYGFVTHGLWPQHWSGAPEFCLTGEPKQVRRQIVDQYLPIMPSPRLIEHQWRKHGTCSGLSQEQYFAATRQAFEGFRVPRDFHEGRLVDADRRTLLTKLTGSNPGTPESAIALRCRGKDLAEVRICLSKGLTPIACGPHVRGSCPRQGIRVRPIR